MRSTFVLITVLAASTAAADTVVSGLTIQPVPLFTADGGNHTLSGVTDLRFLPDGRMVFIEKNGTVKLRALDGTVTVAARFCVDTASEKGLLGVEVDPAFDGTTNQRLFFYYSNCSSDGGTDTNRHRVVSVNLLPSGSLDLSSQKVLVQNLRGPANHDGGGLAIGPDGKLYIGVGDTGCNQACCPAANMFATCLSNGNGKILRINLDGTIPTDNPLVGVAMQTACGNGCTDAVQASSMAAPRTEIWAWGLRNPFRFSFDPQPPHKLWLGDVGESAREEIDIIEKGKHYGYPWYEGTMGGGGYGLSQCNTITPGSGNCAPPVWECSHSNGDCTSISGGAMIDSPLFPAQFRGFWFADNAEGSFSVLHLNATRDGSADGGNSDDTLGHFNSPNNVFPTSVQRGNDGMPYFGMIHIQTLTSGRIVRVVPTGYDGGFGIPVTGTGGGAGGGTGGGTAGTGGGTAGTGGGTAATGGGTAATGGGTAATGGGSGTGGGDMTSGGCHCTQTGDLGSLAFVALAGVTALRRRRMMRP